MSEEKQTYTSPDFGKVFGIAVIVFVGFFTMPFWYTMALGQPSFRPQPTMPSAGGNCIMDTDLIRVEHMALLDTWRNAVVRDGQRTRDGMEINQPHAEQSLTNTCLGCHTNRAEFCDVCHEYAGEAPYCWDCHVDSNTLTASSSREENAR